MKCVKCAAELPDGAKFCHLCGKKQQPDPRKRRKRSNGTGTISKLSGKRSKPYLARLRNISIGTYATVQEAEKALNRLTDRIVEVNFNLTFSEVYEAWKPTHTALLKSRAIERGAEVDKTSGMEGYASAYKNCAELHDKKFRALRIGDLQSVVDRVRDEGKSKSVADKIKQLYGQLYKWAVGECIVQSNLAPSVLVVAEKKKPKEVFSSAEIEKLKKSDNPAAQIALILLGCGGRINELFSALTDRCSATHFTGGSKSVAGIDRVIPVSPPGADAYRALLTVAMEKKCKYLIDAYTGNRNPGNYRKRDYYPMLSALGIPKKQPRCTRRTYATNAVQNGVRPEDLTKILGHSDYSTTIKYYDHPDTEQLVKAAQAVYTTA